MATWYHNCPNPKKSFFANSYSTSQMSTWSNVSVATDYTVVANGRSSIDDGVITDYGIRVYHCTRDDDYSNAKLNGRCNYCLWVDCIYP